MALLKEGSKGPKVKEAQTMLVAAGFRVVIDGDFGKATKAAVKAFQKLHSLKQDGVVGPLTAGLLNVKLGQAQVVKVAVEDGESHPVATTKTPWMDFLIRNVGQKEIAGTKANQFIVDLFQYTSIKNLKLALSDETAWCAACACAALRKNGMKDPNSASAASFDTYGEKLDEPKFGCVVTFKTTTGSRRHVTFYSHTDAQGRLVCLGGNQGNALKYSAFSKAKVAQYRWPVPLEANARA